MQVMSTDNLVMVEDQSLFKPFVRYVMPDSMAAHWTGLDVCKWKLSGISSFERRYGGQDLNGKRLLICRFHGMGDQLIVTALPKYLKSLYPDARIDMYSAESYASAVWRGNPNVFGSRVIPLPLELDAVRQYDYHLFYDGMIEMNREFDQANAYDDMFAFAGLHNVPDEFKRPDIHPVEGDDELFKELIRPDTPYLVYAISTSSPIRNYPWLRSEQFIKIFLERHPEWRVVVIGTTDGMEDAPGAWVFEGVDWLVDKVPDLRQHFPIIENADMFVGPDTGFLHIAGAYNTPIVGLFGPFSWDSRARYYNGVGIERREVCPRAPCWQHGMEIPRKRCEAAEGYCDDEMNCRVVAGIRPYEIIHKVEGLL